MKKTFKELKEIDAVVGEIYARLPLLKASKFGYAYKRLSEKSIYPIFEDYNELLGFLRLDNSLVDPKTKAVIIKADSARGFEFDKAGLKAVIIGERKLAREWDNKEFEVKPYILKKEDMPEGLTDEEKEILEGLLF